jgi:hypothetical protein
MSAVLAHTGHRKKEIPQIESCDISLLVLGKLKGEREQMAHFPLSEDRPFHLSGQQ